MAANQQMMAMQTNIRNTLTSQADMRTAMINNQQQSNQDWWFQVQQQQLARQQARSRGSSAAAAAMAESEAVAESPKTENNRNAEDSIIAWPPILQDENFAEQRAMVEAPYRREPKGKAVPTVEDYQNMIQAADQMKVILGNMTSVVTAQVYLHAEKFLDQLAAEAKQRIEDVKK
jgi:hypothetical protein